MPLAYGLFDPEHHLEPVQQLLYHPNIHNWE